MSQKSINIEYCGSWGFRGSAGRLRNILQQAFPNNKVAIHEAPNVTSKIEVKVVEGEKTNVVWSDTKAKTESNHEEIKKKVQSTIWLLRKKPRSNEVIL